MTLNDSNPATVNQRDTLLQLRNDISSDFIENEDDYIQRLISKDPICSYTEIATSCKKRLQVLQDKPANVFDQLLQEYNLGSAEGLALMALAEALLRTPDKQNREQLILDKLLSGHWEKHHHAQQPLWLSLLTESLNQTSHWFHQDSQNMLQRFGLHTLGFIVAKAVRIMGKHFVFCEDIQQIDSRAKYVEKKGYDLSFDMLGEAALNWQQATNYFNSYKNALIQLEGTTQSLSIKLSALHPRFEANQQKNISDKIHEILLSLITIAARQNTAITIDAEEQDKLEITILIIERLLLSDELQGYQQLGLAIQAYGKRAASLIKYLYAFCDQHNKKMQIRLVKGAYWDSEIKQAQQFGLDDYPVFTQKSATDLNYLHCVDLLLDQQRALIYPMFATHNTHTCEAILYKTKSTNLAWEFQRLHGMGDDLYDSLFQDYPQQLKCRIYAPIGPYKELLPYLVRRLIENGANSSFIFQSKHKNLDSLTQHPLLTLQHLKRQQQTHQYRNQLIPLPIDCLSYKNSTGPALYEIQQRDNLIADLELFQQWQADPLVSGYKPTDETEIKVLNPNNNTIIGSLSYCTQSSLSLAIDNARSFLVNNHDEQECKLLNLALLLEKHQSELISLCILEAGKIFQDAIDEVREAIDFCRYYHQQQKELKLVQTLDSIAGESNQYYFSPKGIVLCISPWNFPLAIFIGQITAALATGNAVLAKPARQTSLIAHKAISLIHQAGFDKKQCQLLLGSGATISEYLLEKRCLNLICMTGSTATAKTLQQQSLLQDNNLLPIIAETGGQNVMIADSTCLLEQLIKDIIQSAFQSSGQRCSALRVAYIQEDIFEDFCSSLKGAMELLICGNSHAIETDIGPIIDPPALDQLQQHLHWLKQHAKPIAQSPQPENQTGHFLAPSAWQINSLKQLKQEHFGPILHVISYKTEDLPDIINDINNSGYGLTLGLQSRNQHWLDDITRQLKVGNIYINRNMIGAKVGAQPFGGTGLSGTGPKAGGPDYLKAFCNEQCISQNLMAIGGDSRLLNL